MRRPSVPGALYQDIFMRSGAVRTARLAHNQKVDGSNPSSRTQLAFRYRKGSKPVPGYRNLRIKQLVVGAILTRQLCRFP